jgi:cytolysin (calcineurin-like family phosphatase)
MEIDAMSTHASIKFFACLLLFSASSVVQAVEGMPLHMVFASDPQYPWTEKSDSGEPESAEDFEKRSKWLLDSQFSSIADFRMKHGAPSQVPLMINGDMTAFGHGWQRSYLESTLNKYFAGDYLYGLGNHDYQNNVDDCFSNSCAAGSIVEFKEHHLGKVDEIDLRISGGALYRLYSGSLAYSKNIGEVHMVQLNNEPTYRNRISHVLNPAIFEITSSLDWLEQDLKSARAQGYAIIINMHKPDGMMGDWEEVKRFWEILARYEVTAIFAGHYHRNGGQVSYLNGVPMFLSGGASQETYLIASFSEDRKQLHVSLVKNNDWQARELIQTVPVKSVFASRP